MWAQCWETLMFLEHQFYQNSKIARNYRKMGKLNIIKDIEN
mgnify:CR=1 FL=1